MPETYPVPYTSTEVLPSGSSGNPGGSVSLETPTGSVNGSNKNFVFSGTPVAVFRNGVQETRLGSVVGSTFTFVTAPESGDDIEGLV